MSPPRLRGYGRPRGTADLYPFQRDEPEPRDPDTCNAKLLSKLILGAWRRSLGSWNWLMPCSWAKHSSPITPSCPKGKRSFGEAINEWVRTMAIGEGVIEIEDQERKDARHGSFALDFRLPLLQK